MVQIVKFYYTYTHPCMLFSSKFTTMKRVIGILESSKKACLVLYSVVPKFVIFYQLS